MLTTELYKKIEDILPESLCCTWDNDGLSVLPEKAHESQKLRAHTTPPTGRWY